jgi:hypothetical protein
MMLPIFRESLVFSATSKCFEMMNLRESGRNYRNCLFAKAVLDVSYFLVYLLFAVSFPFSETAGSALRVRSMILMDV